MRRLRMALSIMAVLIVVMSTTVALTFAMWLFLPRETKQPLRLRIPYRATMRDVLNLLERDGWSHPRWLFRRVAHKLDIPRRLQAGEFVIEPPVSRWRLMQALRQQRPHLISVTIPPGLMSSEIARKLARAGLVNPKRFIALVHKPPEGLKLPGLPSNKSVEGFLFPETYSFPPLRPGRDEVYVIRTMLSMFDRRFLQRYQSRIKSNDHSLYELVTLASLVELEAKYDNERPLVAAVLWNRLARRMPLQCDASIFYALGKRKRRILYRDLMLNSPYNTYRNYGLPPTPVCNPGLASLKAALQPAKVDYLYYVACGDGRHVFSRSYAEHLRAVRRWRRIQRKSGVGQ